MSHGFIDETAEGFYKQQGNFCDKIDNYALGLDVLKVAKIKADRLYLGYEIETRAKYIKYDASWTSHEKTLIHGVDNGIVSAPPPLPTLSVAPAGVHPGMRDRFSDIAADSKKSTNYSVAIGIDLGIEATITPFVPANGKPAPKYSLHVGHPYFKYLKDQYQGAQIYKDWGDGKGYVKFDKAISSSYTDNSALPASGVAALWKYRFVYLYQDAEVGTASDIIEITVTGM